MLEPGIYININAQIKGLLSANGHSVLGETLVFHPGVPGSIPGVGESISKIHSILFIN